MTAMTPPNPRHPLPSVEDGRPKPLNLLGTYAHHPALAQAFFTFNGHLMRQTTLTERQRELIVLRVGARRASLYELTQHYYTALDVGMTHDEIVRVEADPTSTEWSDLDRAILSAVDELIDTGTIGDATWAVLSADFDAEQLLDVIYTVGCYETVAFMMNALHVPLDESLRELRARTHPGTLPD